MIRGWQGFRRWAIRCVRWIPTVRGWERTQEAIGKHNMKLIEKRESELMGSFLLGDVDMTTINPATVTADKIWTT